MSRRTTGRVMIPENPADFLKLAKTIYDKHVALGAASPLNTVADYDWNAEGPKIQICTQDHEDAEQYAKDAENAYRRRDINLKPLRAMVKNGAALLKSANSKNPKNLGDWGIVVDDTVQVKKTTTPKQQ